jgi:hypothetical protein
MLAVCRDWGQPLSWWAALDPADRALVVADYRMRQREATRGQR